MGERPQEPLESGALGVIGKFVLEEHPIYEDVCMLFIVVTPDHHNETNCLVLLFCQSRPGPQIQVYISTKALRSLL
jgi:hypothetical protein